MEDERAKITGVVLAGGRAQRMGGKDKGLVVYRGRPLVAYALAALRQVTKTIIINANRNQAEYAGFGYPVLPDPTHSFDGPLAGLLCAMQTAQTDFVLSVPCDCPQLDGNLLDRLHATLMATAGAEICVAHDGKRMQPLFLLAQRCLASDLANYLASGQRKVETWLRSHRLALVDCSDHPEWFVNINTLEELERMETGQAIKP